MCGGGGYRCCALGFGGKSGGVGSLVGGVGSFVGGVGFFVGGVGFFVGGVGSGLPELPEGSGVPVGRVPELVGVGVTFWLDDGDGLRVGAAWGAHLGVRQVELAGGLALERGQRVRLPDLGGEAGTARTALAWPYRSG